MAIGQASASQSRPAARRRRRRQVHGVARIGGLVQHRRDQSWYIRPEVRITSAATLLAARKKWLDRADGADASLAISLSPVRRIRSGGTARRSSPDPASSWSAMSALSKHLAGPVREL